MGFCNESLAARKSEIGTAVVCALGVLDYGLGNVGSVLNMARRLRIDARLVSSPEQVQNCDRVILPGVGSFDRGVNLLRGAWGESVVEHVDSGKPMLGICLGMQLLLSGSEEGELSGLGFLPGTAVRFNNSELRVPHMGWNRIEIARTIPLLDRTDEDARFYFAHSYHARMDDDNDVAATCEYGSVFPVVIARDNVMGVQFHPEKSHVFGMRLLERFSEL